MKKKKLIIKAALIVISLTLVMLEITGCGGVAPVENPFIEVTSPKEGDIIDGKDGYIEVEWVANDLRVNYVYIDFACAYNKNNKGTQIGDWERIGNVSADDGYFIFGPNIASWILDVFGVVPDICQIRVMEAVGDDPEFEWVYDYSGVFTVTFD